MPSSVEYVYKCEMTRVPLEEPAQRQEERCRHLEQHSREIGALPPESDRALARLSREIAEMESTLAGLRARWGMMSESAFREGLVRILTEENGLRVKHCERRDAEGIAFGADACSG